MADLRSSMLFRAAKNYREYRRLRRLRSPTMSVAPQNYPAYVINLERSPERRLYITSHLRNLGIEPTVVPAFDGKKLSLDELIRDGRYDDRDGRYDRNDHYRGNANAIARQIEQLRYRIQRTDGRDRISEREAAGLRRAVYNLQQQFRDFNRNGLSQRESQYLQQRINQIRERLRYERRDDDGRRW